MCRNNPLLTPRTQCVKICPLLRQSITRDVLEFWIRNCFGTFDLGELDLWPSDPNINKVPLLHYIRMDMWTNFEEGRSRHSPVTDLSSSKGGHNILTTCWNVFFWVFLYDTLKICRMSCDFENVLVLKAYRLTMASTFSKSAITYHL